MGREVRRVPADWEHPQEDNPYTGRRGYKPMHGRDWASEAAEWDAERERWERGERPSYASDEAADLPYDQWSGPRPYSGDYMPNWTEAERTHLMMYEDTSEGTPISPAFKTPEELAQWLADSGASAFGSSTASYEAWLNIARGGWAPSMVISSGVMMSGVEFSTECQS